MKKYISPVLLLIMVLLSGYFFQKFGYDRDPFYGDGLGYYMYLPSTFIYHNLDDLTRIPENADVGSTVIDYAQQQQDPARVTPTGHFLIQYTCGVAYFEAPFFFIAHAIAHATGLQANGYSEIYTGLIKIGYFIYALIAFLILYRVLRRYVRHRWAIASLFFIYLGTNLFWFDTVQFGMAHPILFMLYAFTIYYSIKLYESEKHRYLYLLAGVLGFMVLIRPTDLIALLIPIFYGISKKSDFLQRLEFFAQKLKYIILSLPIAITPSLPQMIYWKKYAASFFYNSYANQQFHWAHPRILEGVFGFKNGWLPYSVILIPALLFLIIYARKNKKLFLPSILILILHIYITYSWECFNYINGYGSRPMIHIYPLLAIPLAIGLERLQRWRIKALGILLLAWMLFSTAHNQSMMWQQCQNIAFSEESCPQFYFSTMFNKSIDYNDLITYDTRIIQPLEKELKLLQNFRFHGFEEEDSNHVPLDSRKGKVCIARQGQEFPAANFHEKLEEEIKADYIRIQGDFYLTSGQWGIYHQPLMTFSITRDGKQVWQASIIYNKLCMDGSCHPTPPITFWQTMPFHWGTLHYYIPLDGQHLLPGDIIDYGVWNLSLNRMYIDNLRLDLFDKK